MEQSEHQTLRRIFKATHFINDGCNVATEVQQDIQLSFAHREQDPVVCTPDIPVLIPVAPIEVVELLLQDTKLSKFPHFVRDLLDVTDFGTTPHGHDFNDRAICDIAGEVVYQYNLFV